MRISDLQDEINKQKDTLETLIMLNETIHLDDDIKNAKSTIKHCEALIELSKLPRFKGEPRV